MDGNPPAESEEVAALTQALLSNAVVRADCSLSLAQGRHNELFRCRCEFPSRQRLLSAAHQVVLCRNSSLDQEAFKAIKRGLSAKLAGMEVPGVWTIGHLVQLLQHTGFVSGQVTRERWGYIDARVAATLRSKEVAQQSNSNAVTSLAVSGSSRRAAASTLTLTELSESPGSAMVPFDVDSSAQLDQSGHLQDLSNLKGEEAVQLVHAAFDCQDKGQLQLLVQALVAERDQSRKSREYFRKKASNLSQELSKSKHEAEQLRHGIVHYSKRRKI